MPAGRRERPKPKSWLGCQSCGATFLDSDHPMRSVGKWDAYVWCGTCGAVTIFRMPDDAERR